MKKDIAKFHQRAFGHLCMFTYHLSSHSPRGGHGDEWHLSCLVPEGERWASFSKNAVCFDLCGTSLNTWLPLFCPHENSLWVGAAFGVIRWQHIKAHTSFQIH